MFEFYTTPGSRVIKHLLVLPNYLNKTDVKLNHENVVE